jgi:hypothetical protein
MKNMVIRCLIAVVCVAIAWALIPLVLSAIGFSMAANIESILKIVIAVVALYYIVWGPPVPFPAN